MRKPFELGFASAAQVLVRAAENRRRRLTANGLACDVKFMIPMRPEVALMRAGVARSSGLSTGASPTAVTEPAMQVCHGPIGGGR